MKCRFGFIGNSSSSSFLAFLPTKDTKITITIDLAEFGDVFKTIEDLKEYFCESEEELIKYGRAKEVETIKNGGTVIFGSCNQGYSEDPDLITYLSEKKKNIVDIKICD